MRKAPSLSLYHYKPDSAPFDWSLLAKSQQTLAIYMGTMKAAEISAQLIAHGRDSDTPWR